MVSSQITKNVKYGTMTYRVDNVICALVPWIEGHQEGLQILPVPECHVRQAGGERNVGDREG